MARSASAAQVRHGPGRNVLKRILTILGGSRLKDQLGTLIFTVNFFTGLPSYRLLKSVLQTLLLVEGAATSETTACAAGQKGDTLHGRWLTWRFYISAETTKRAVAETLVRPRRGSRINPRALSRVAFFFLTSVAAYIASPHQAHGQVAFSTVEGTVSIAAAGGTALVTAAQVVLEGGETLQTETDANGRYKFSGVSPGTYVIEASAPGMHGQRALSVGVGVDVKAALELKLVAVSTSVTVTDNSNGSVNSGSVSTIAGKTISEAPNVNERFESLLPLVPGVVRGPDGRINMKGARNTQSGVLVNSASATDPALGGQAINLPLDVVSSVQVVSNPYDPQYGRFAGAVASVETKTGNYEKYHFSIQNVLPRLRDRAGTIAGIGAATPRMTFTGPLLRDRLAFTQSFEYRFVRTPVNSLPPLQRDTTLEGFDSYTQLDITNGNRQTATISMAVYPQKLDYIGLNTFTPQPSTADFRQRGYEFYVQHRYVSGPDSILTSQFSYRTYDVDVNGQSNDPYRLMIDTTEGGFFNRQDRDTSQYDWQESYRFAPRLFIGSHQFTVGLDFAHSSLQARETSLPVQLIGSSGKTIEQISFTSPVPFNVGQNETATYASDQWVPTSRLSLGLGFRLDGDSVTGSTNVAPRASVLLALTGDGKTLVRGGAGIFYDRVPLMLPAFSYLPERTVSTFDSSGQVSGSTAYQNVIVGALEDPRSTSWNAELERQVTRRFTARVGYDERHTSRDFVISPVTGAETSVVSLSNSGSDSYREFQVTGRYQARDVTLNASYVRSRAYGDLNDPLLFIGNDPQAVIQADSQARQLFDVPNRVLIWPEVTGPWKLNSLPVCDVHTGFPYSVENEYHQYIGGRDDRRFPRFSSCDLQITRPATLHLAGRRLPLIVGGSVFNVFNHDNPRDVQNDVDSSTFGRFYNPAWREFRAKLVFRF